MSRIYIDGIKTSLIGGGGGTQKKKYLIVSRDVNPSSLVEMVIDQDFEVYSVPAATYNSYANAYETDLFKYFYDVPGTYHQYYWNVIAKTNLIYNSISYSAGDVVDYWYYNESKELIIEEA